MKKFISICLIVVLSLMVGGIAYASDVSDAKYKTTINIENAGDALTNAIAILEDFSTASLISGGLLSATANDCALLTGAGGSDLVVMPSANASYPWVMWVNSVGAASSVKEYLYHSGVTGGEIMYFPASAGMTTTDNASLEPSDNFTTEWAGYFYPSVSGNISIKAAAYKLAADGSGNVTSLIPVSPASFTDPSSKWGDEAKAYDSSTATYCTCWDIAGVSWEDDYVYYAPSAGVLCDTISIWADVTSAATESINVDAYYGGAWHDVYQGTFDDLTWVDYDVGSLETITEIRINLYNPDGGLSTGNIYEVNLLGNIVSASGVTEGDRIFRLWADTTYMHFSVDGVETDNYTLSGLSIVDNSSDIVDFSEGVIAYADYVKRWVNGTLVQHISWQYGTTFTDQSGNGNDATPSFRTTASDEDLTASILSQEGIATGSTPAASSSTGWTMLGSTPATPEDLFTEGDDTWGIASWNMGEMVTDAAEDAGQDATTWHFLIAYGLAALCFLAAYGLTHSSRLGRRGSLIIAAAVGLLPLIYFYRMGTIPGFTLIPYGLMSLIIVMWRRDPSPTG